MFYRNQQDDFKFCMKGRNSFEKDLLESNQDNVILASRQTYSSIEKKRIFIKKSLYIYD